MKQISIIPIKRANKLIIENKNIYYYMSQNYDYYLELNKKFGTDIEIRNLSGLFNEVFQDIKNPLIELLAGINKEYKNHFHQKSIFCSSTSILTFFLAYLSLSFLFYSYLLSLDTTFLPS